jgi:hypothetical protein
VVASVNMQIDASLWSVPTNLLADRLYQSLEKVSMPGSYFHGSPLGIFRCNRNSMPCQIEQFSV